VFVAEAFGSFVEDRYTIGRVVECVLYRSYANEVYRIRAAQGTTYFFKVARRSWRSLDDVRWEAELQIHLNRHRIPVAEPLPQRSGNVVAVLEAPEGRRAAVLYEETLGQKPHPPHSPALYSAFGAAAARMHDAMDRFDAPSPRPARSTEWLVTMSTAIVSAQLALHSDERAFVDAFGTWLAGEIDSRAPSLEWGICHGDLTLDNLRIDDNGTVTFFDFDLATPAWRVSDLCGLYTWSLSDDSAVPLWHAFLAGYRTERRFTEAEEAAVPFFAAAYDLWDLAHEIEHWRRWSGLWRSTDQIIAERLGRLRQWQERFTGD
jgi:Ser/Thr protein kinase RdoA (MazF antagonist)